MSRVTSLKPLIDGIPVTFESTLDPELALRNLHRLTLWEPGKVELAGSVQSDQVVIFRLPRSSNARFEGVLTREENGSVLVGSFVVSKMEAVMAGVFLTIVALLAFFDIIVGLDALALHRGDALGVVCVTAASLLVLGLFAAVIVWSATPRRADVRVISAAIRAAMQG